MSFVRRNKYLLVGVTALFVLAAVSVGPLYKQIKQHRAQSHSAEALELIEKGDFKAATEKAHSAYHLFPESAEVCRVVARLYGESDPNKAVQFWQEAYKISGDLVDLEKVAEFALLGGQLEVANDSLLILENELRGNAGILFLRADWFLRNRQVDRALEVASKIVTLPNPPKESHFFFVQVSQFSDDPHMRQQGLDYLRELTLRKDELGLDSLRNLAQFDKNTLAERQEIMQLLREHPLAEPNDQLVALKLQTELPDADVEEIVAEAKSHFDLEDPAQLTELGRWLNRLRLHHETIKLVSIEQAMKRQDLFLVRVDAMAVMNMWDEIGSVLQDKQIPIDTYLRLLFEARVGIETGSTRKADIAWTRAKLSVANEPQKLWFLANYAKRLSLFKEARSVLERLTEIPSSMRKAYEEIIRLEQKQGETRRLRDTFVKMIEVYPNDIAVVNDLAYTNLLLNENIETSFSEASRLVSVNPEYLANRITLALAYYRLEKNENALSILKNVDVDWEQVKVGWRAIYAAILRDGGHETEAQSVLLGIDPSMLLPEEKRLLSQNS